MKKITNHITVINVVIIFFFALVLNVLKNIFERSGKPFNKFRASAIIFFLIIFTMTTHLCADNTTTFHRYFWANYNHFSGNITHAQNWYQKLFSTNNSIYTYKGYLNFLSDTKQFKQITDLIPTLAKKFETDAEIQLIFANALEKTNQANKADTLIIQLSQSFKTHPDITFRATQTYIRRREPENALLTIDAFLNNTPRRPNNFVFYFLKTQIFMQLGQLKQSLDSINKCLEMHPQFDKGWLLYASLSEKEGNIKEALTGYSTFLELSGGHKEIEQHLFALMLKHKAIEDNKQILLSHTITIDNALILFKQQRYPQALTHINSCIHQQPLNNECKLLKLQILSAMKDFKTITQTISSWILANPTSELWPKSLCMLAYNGMPQKEILNTFNTILKETPDNMWCNIYYADICMRNKQNNDAINYLNKALSCTMKDSMRTKILYQLALLHHDQDNHQTMLNHLESAHALNQHNPLINNALAYYWATKGKNTSKAHSFIKNALKTDATNPYFLDTQAVILYKEKKYKEAQEILEKLASLNNSIMLLHLAKVHYALNNKENADIFTQKALPLVKNNHEKKALNKMQLLLTQT